MTLSLPLARRAMKCLVPGASAIYLMNEGTGQVLTDYSGNGNHAQLGSAAGADTNDPARLAGGGLSFDGTDNYAIGPSLSGITTGLTVQAFVVKKDDNPQRIVSKTEVGGYYLGFGGEGGGDTVFVIRRSGTYAFLTKDTAAITGPLCITGTFDGRYASLYWGATPDSTNDAGAVYPIEYTYPNNAMMIGVEAGNATAPDIPFSNIDIHAIAVYPFALSVQQVAQNCDYFRALALRRGLVPSW